MNRLTTLVLIALVAGLFFIPFLGGVHLFDWDEINFAEISREMLVLNDYLRVHVDFKPFWEKPPFFFWLQSLAMHTFGVGEFAARLPNALCGILTLSLLYLLGERLFNRRFGLIWVGTYLGSILPHLYFRSGIIDPWFNLWIFIGLNGIIFFRWKKDHFTFLLPKNKWFYLLLGGFLLGMGVLTKGPVAYMLVCVTLGVYFVVNGFKLFISPLHFIVYTVMTSLVTLAWYGLETWQHGPWFIQEFIKYNYRLFSTPDAGHAGFPGYHFVILFFGCFPASTFALRALNFRTESGETDYQRDYQKWMVILFWVVLILFTIVKSKIVHYSSMCYFPLTYLASLTIYRLWTGRIVFSTWMKVSLAVSGGIFVILTIGLPILSHYVDWLQAQIAPDDSFAAANLDAKVNWTGWEAIPGVVLFFVILFGIRFLSRQQYERGLVTLFIGTAVFTTLTLWFFVARIESISQAAAIRFFEARQGEDCYIVTYKYRSYGPFFYARQQPERHPKSWDDEWAIHSTEVDKPVYVIAKNLLEAEVDTIPTLRKIGSENGFVFYKRK
ncbi:glycosyl transferase [Siphonobacter sp. BAB-5405]|uniref:ArnT family glycosyltransferase n=1 Tax=Siphonobacter sp. BAB-5405 TaxID=1864825 RepID=UPI000C81013A|nr:glycosyltransferase family 39 protein [Siphonobacter sp. BAB-5405]PMD96192.1 glycosyl transferase [Siphonobacter sp. BAB-5405]